MNLHHEGTGLKDIIMFRCTDGEMTLKVYKSGEVAWRDGHGDGAQVIELDLVTMAELRNIMSIVGHGLLVSMMRMITSTCFHGQLDMYSIVFICMDLSTNGWGSTEPAKMEKRVELSLWMANELKDTKLSLSYNQIVCGH